MQSGDPLPEQLRRELEDTRRAFHSLLFSFPAADFQRPSPDSPWTLGAEFYHLAQALQFLPFAIARARRGSGFSLFYLVPIPVRDWINGHLLVPLLSRGATPISVLATYDKALKMVLEDLESIRPDEWKRQAGFGRGPSRTLEQVFHQPAAHFAAHQEAIRAKIAWLKG